MARSGSGIPKRMSASQGRKIDTGQRCLLERWSSPDKEGVAVR